MKFKFHINNWINLLLVCVASTLCLLLALPRDSKAGYDYEVGKPWNYAPLIADFEFPIYKSAEQLAAERDSALRTFYPYYNSHEAVAQQQVRNFAADRAAGHFAGVPDAYITYASRCLCRRCDQQRIDESAHGFGHLRRACGERHERRDARSGHDFLAPHRL